MFFQWAMCFWSRSLSFWPLRAFGQIQNIDSASMLTYFFQELDQMTQSLTLLYISCTNMSSSNNIWPLHKCGSNWFLFLIWNLTYFRNPFHEASWNRKLSYFAESNRMTFFHAVKACKNRLFRLNNRLFYWLSWIFFWKLILFGLWINT